jgi:hypothetical protein
MVRTELVEIPLSTKISLLGKFNSSPGENIISVLKKPSKQAMTQRSKMGIQLIVLTFLF